MNPGNAKENPTLILASASPRRRELLTEAGFSFTAKPADIDETAYPAAGHTPAEHARNLALAKARQLAEAYPDVLVLGADTLVDLDGRIIGKPTDPHHAEAIIRLLFSRPHRVITAIALVRESDNTCIVEHETTTIYPRKMTEAQLCHHIRSQSWQGKAGAYAIAEHHDPFIEKIEGSRTNVMGLPLELLTPILRRLLP
jgi:septum formation protein